MGAHVTKKRIVILVLVALAIWPWVHQGLVAYYDLDPWRFFGFAMYAVPPSSGWAHLIEIRDGDEVHFHYTTLKTEPRAAWEDYSRRRPVWGRLLEPHRIADAVFESRAGLQELKIIVARDIISRSTALVESTNGMVYHYKRADDPASE